MGIEAMRIRVQIRRFLAISIRTCYRSVCKHPFLVGMVCFLIFLYRSFPFLFSLLVSASPVLVCTAILLGTLLSFGEPNIPEIEKEQEKEKEEEEEVFHEISTLKAGVVEDATVVVERDESFSVERFVGKKMVSGEKATEEESLAEKKESRIEDDDGLGEYMPLIGENSREIQFERQVIEEVERESNYLELEKKREIHKENLGIEVVLSHREVVANQYSLVQNVGDEILKVEDDNFPGEFIEAQKGDHLDFSLDSSWKRANDDEEEEASDSGSDGAESSSPDASMADIIPMLDELHPLLDEEAPQPAHISHDGSDGGSELSHRSKESSVASEEEVENLADEEEDGDDDNEEEDEEAQGGKEDDSKSAIKWTEDDQKNLIDLGTLELERNQRLESLIARRRARRNLRMVAEKNLIDLDGADLPFNIPAISTARSNPFDLPYDDVPGSAPSILLPRRNPFDLPYDSNEEKPDLKGDSFQQEFSAFQHREPLFRRHESFSMGPSVLAGPKQERQDLRWKPYFVPERFATEGTSYSIFQRQLSEVSDSKVSSVPDTDSVSSALEEEDKRLNEEDVSQEMISNVDRTSLLVERGSLSSEDLDSLDIEQVEKRDVHHDGVDITLGHVQNHHETDSSLSTSGGATPVELNTSEILLRMGPGAEEYSSRSSLSSLSEIDEKISDVQKGSTSLEPTSSQIEGSQISIQNSVDSDFHFMGGDTNQLREPVLEPRDDHIGESLISMQTLVDSDFHFTSGVVNDNQHREPVLELAGDRIGHSGNLKETSIKSDLQFMTGVADGRQESDSEPRGNHIGESGSTQTSLKSNFHFTNMVVLDNQHKEPLYDSSPPSVEKFLSFSSISSDTQGEISEMGSPPALAEYADKESEVHTESMEKDTSGYKEMLEGSSQGRSLDESESRLREVTDISEPDFTKIELLGVHPNVGSKDGFMKPESAVEHVSVDLPASSSDNGSVKEGVAYKEESSLHEWDQLHSSSRDAEIIVRPHQGVIEQSDSASSSHQMATEEIKFPAIEEQHLPVVVEHVLAEPKFSSSKAEPAEEHAIVLEETLELEQDQVPSSSFDGDIYVNGCQAMGQELDLVASSSEHILSNGLNLFAHEERQPAVVAEKVSDAYLNISSSETKHKEEHSLRKEENLQFEQGQVQSSSFDATVGDSLHQDVDLTVVSSGSSFQHVPAVENSLLELEKQLSWSDKSMVEQSFNNHDEPQEPSITLAESTDDVSSGNNVNVPEVYESEDKMSRHISSLMSDSTLVLPDSQEYKSPAAEVVLKDDILDKIVYEDSGHVLEHSNYLVEAHGSHVAEANIHEEEDEIKEIDEGLLSELDTVGDFSVKEVVGELLHDEQLPENASNRGPEFDLLPKDSSLIGIKTELPVLEVRSVEDVELAFRQLHEGVDVEEVILPSKIEDQLVVDESNDHGETSSDLRVAEARSLEDIHIVMKQVLEGNAEELSDSKDAPVEVNEAGSSQKLPVLEVRTIEDIDLAFKQLHEGVDVEEVILPSEIEDQLVLDESKGPGETTSHLQVVEARSLEDINIAMKQVSVVNTEILSESKDELAEVTEAGSSKKLPVLEVGTIEDIDLAFKQLHEGVDVGEVILPSMLEQRLVVDEPRDPGQTCSNLQVVEAKSLEEIHIAMKQVLEDNIEELPKRLDPKDKPAEENKVGSTKEYESRTLEVNEVDSIKDIESSSEVGSVKEIESSIIGSGVQESIAVASHDPKHGFDETSENSRLSIVDTKGKKAKSPRSSSSSSSGSSSSDSD